MKSIIYKLLSPITLGLFALSMLIFSQPVGAVNPLDNTCAQSTTISGSQICQDKSDNLFTGSNSFWKRLINIMIFIVGAVAVLMLVVGGLRYVLSGGDASSTKSAKDTILYAIVGVIIALSAYAIVNFVVVNLL